MKVGHLDNRVRSKGCLSCIRMKVKCDQGVPSCQRCLRARRECPGYRQPTTTFVLQSSGSSSRQYIAGVIPPRETSLSAALPTDWTEHAVTHYVHQFVVHSDSDGGLPGMHADLPELCMKFPRTGYFQTAVSAVAMVNFARVRKMTPEYSAKAQELYGISIGSLRVALNDVGESSSPTALMTTELLTEYDLISGHVTSSKASTHQDGMLYILCQLLENDANTTPSVAQGAFTYILIQNLLNPTHLPPPLASYPDTPPTPFKQIMCNFLPMFYSAGIIRYKVSKMAEPRREAGDLLADLLRIDRDLVAWEMSVPAAWWYTTLSRTTAGIADLEWPQSFTIFTGVSSVMMWNVFWMTRLSVLFCLDEIEPPSTTYTETRTTLCAIVDRICTAVPHMTGQVSSTGESQAQASLTIVGSLFALRSLQMASQSPHISDFKRLWITQQLEFLGRHRGVG